MYVYDICSESNYYLPIYPFGCDSLIRRFALLDEDMQLFSKLSAGDLIAQEGSSVCKLTLHNKACKLLPPTNPQSNSIYMGHGIALAKLLTYVDETWASQERIRVFKLC